MNDLRNIPDEFRHCSNMMRRIYHHNGPINTRHGQGKLMNQLLVTDGATIKELCKDMRMQLSSVTTIAHKAERNGFVTQAIDTADSSTFRISLTEIGRTVAEKRAEANNKVADTIFAEFSEEERTQLEGLLAKLDASLEQQLASSSDDRRHQHRSMHSRRYDGKCKCDKRHRPKNNQYVSRSA